MKENNNKLNVSISYSLDKPACLNEPNIMHNITELKYIDIFRVYKPDPKYFLTKTNTLSNWHGHVLDNNIRDKIRVGNILRMCIGIKGKEGHMVIYFRLLHQVSQTRFLATIVNMYQSIYEDIVIVIDIGAVTEIPMGMKGNENLVQYDITEGLRYMVTGNGALDPGAENYDLNYDSLFENNGMAL